MQGCCGNRIPPYLADVGVAVHKSGMVDQNSGYVVTTAEILLWMDSMDVMYLMRVVSVGANVVTARRMYRVVGNGSVAVYDNNQIEYADIDNVHHRVQLILES